jgi:transcriptional regulator GlxA family with amidase domain
MSLVAAHALEEKGKTITSAGVSAGIDMAFHFARIVSCEEYAKMLQSDLEYDPDPPVSIPKFSALPKAMEMNARAFLKRDIRNVGSTAGVWLELIN